MGGTRSLSVDLDMAAEDDLNDGDSGYSDATKAPLASIGCIKII